MKNMMTAIFLSLVLCAIAAGQDDHLKALSDRLRLSPDQQTRIKVIFDDQLARVQAIKNDASPATEDRVRKERGLRDASALRIRDLLNDDQRRIFDEMQRVHAGQGDGQGSSQRSHQGIGEGFGIGRGCEMPGVDDHLTFLSGKLNLSQDQQARIKRIVDDQLAQLQKVREDETLSREERMNKVHSLRAASASRVREELTDDQKPKFDAMQQEMRASNGPGGADCAMIWIVEE